MISIRFRFLTGFTIISSAQLNFLQAMAQSSPPLADPDCTFCKISASIPLPGVVGNQKSDTDQKPKIESFFADDQLFVIEDIKPKTKHHYLVITRQHIESAKCLTRQHEGLVQRMVEVGAQVLKDRHKDGQVDVRNIHLGFHWPPLTMIKHLHMHVMYPASGLSFVSKNVIFRPGLLFVTPDDVIERIRALPDQ